MPRRGRKRGDGAGGISLRAVARTVNSNRAAGNGSSAYSIYRKGGSRGGTGLVGICRVPFNVKCAQAIAIGCSTRETCIGVGGGIGDLHRDYGIRRCGCSSLDVKAVFVARFVLPGQPELSGAGFACPHHAGK